MENLCGIFASEFNLQEFEHILFAFPTAHIVTGKIRVVGNGFKQNPDQNIAKKYCVSYKNLALFNFSAYVNNGIQYLKTKTLFPFYNIVKRANFSAFSFVCCTVVTFGNYGIFVML